MLAAAIPTVASAAGVTLLPNAYGVLTANVGYGITAADQTSYVAPGAITVQDLNGDSATAATSFGNGGSASVSINGPSSNAQASVGYSFEFTGPSGVLIPIIVSGQLSLSEQGGNLITDSLAGASVEIGWNNAVRMNPFVCTGEACYFQFGYNAGVSGPAPTAETFSYNLYIPSNTLASVLVFAEAISAGGYPTGAIADPYIQINSNFANAGQFAFIESAGIVNSPVAGVPETSTWAMMLLGFAGLGFAGYRGSRKSAALAV